MAESAAFHAHVYFGEADRARAAELNAAFRTTTAADALPRVLYVGRMVDKPIGPHPLPQFEIHFLASERPEVVAIIEASGLRALVHPLTDDDLADHTTLAHWVGEPLDLDLSVLDPPGVNQGEQRFGKADL